MHQFTRLASIACIAIVSIVSLAVLSPAFAADLDYTIKLKTGYLEPDRMRSAPAVAASLQEKHALIQFDDFVTDDQRQAMASDGIELLQYVPNYAYTVKLNGPIDDDQMALYGIRWLGPMEATYKIDPRITYDEIPQYARRRGGGMVQFTVVLHPDADLNQQIEYFQREFNAEIIGAVETIDALEVFMPESFVSQAAELDEVTWIEAGMPEPVEHNATARVNNGAEFLQESPFDLSGLGVVVAEWDGGRVDASHPDLFRRVTAFDGVALSTHATHVAGTVMGDGTASSGTYRGMAPEAELLSYLWWSSTSEMESEYANSINNFDARIATNSWGYGVGDPATETQCQNVLGTYLTTNLAIDNLVRGSVGAPISICWSAGNQRSSASDQCGSLGWTYGTIGALSTSKNIITVGAIFSSSSNMTSFSSWGPVDDGRLKPDVVGPGCSITSCATGTGYTSMCGTSMSTPATAGVLALLYEQFDKTIGTGSILPSTMKGLLINTADDLGETGPDYAYGHGRVDGVEAAAKLATGAGSWVEDSITTGQMHTYEMTVPSSSERVKVTIVWDDAIGLVTSEQMLVNDLDLVLTDPFGGTHQPWVLLPTAPSFPATRGEDHINNVETVEIENPVGGLWTATVTGTNIPDGPQTYSIIFTPDSAHRPGNTIAVGALTGGSVGVDPGASVTANFWATNVGLNSDSIRVQISDSLGWLETTVDTVVELAPYDSAAFQLTITAPGTAVLGDYTMATISTVSLTDTSIHDENSIQATTNAVHAVSMLPLSEDTVESPMTYPLAVTISNDGNTVDVITVVPTDERGWIFSPAFKSVTLEEGRDSLVTFSVAVPAEEPHLAVNNVSVRATISAGPTADTIFVPLVVDNAVFPPALDSPEPQLYTQDRLHTFSWSDDQSSDSYSLYIATDPSISNLVRTYTGITDQTFAMPGGDELTDGTYYWGVRKFIAGDSSSLQLNPHSIVVDNSPPAPVLATAPVDDYVDARPVTIEFTADGAAESLAPELGRVEIASDSLFSSPVVVYDSVGAFSFVMPDSLPEGRFYWRVRRYDLAGNTTAYSPVATFILDTQAPILPTMTEPADGTIFAPDTVVFRWLTDAPPVWEESPEYYFVHVSNHPLFTDYNTFANYAYDTLLKLPAETFDVGTTYYWRIRAFDSSGHSSEYTEKFNFTYQPFVCGNADGSSDGIIDVGDLTFVIGYLFAGGQAPDPVEAGSINCDTTVDVGDVTAYVSFLFLSGDEPCCPF